MENDILALYDTDFCGENEKKEDLRKGSKKKKLHKKANKMLKKHNKYMRKLVKLNKSRSQKNKENAYEEDRYTKDEHSEQGTNKSFEAKLGNVMIRVLEKVVPHVLMTFTTAVIGFLFKKASGNGSARNGYAAG